MRLNADSKAMDIELEVNKILPRNGMHRKTIFTHDLMAKASDN